MRTKAHNFSLTPTGQVGLLCDKSRDSIRLLGVVVGKQGDVRHYIWLLLRMGRKALWLQTRTVEGDRDQRRQLPVFRRQRRPRLVGNNDEHPSHFVFACH